MSTPDDRYTTILTATDYTLLGPLERHVRKHGPAVAKFKHAICTQGPDRGPDGETVRQRAISMALVRARANVLVPNAAFRLLCEIADVCRLPWRYCAGGDATLAYFIGRRSGSNVSRDLGTLVELGFVAAIDFPIDGEGYRRARYVAVVCTVEDRLGRSRKVLADALDNDQAVKDDNSSPTFTTKAGGHQLDGQPTFTTKVGGLQDDGLTALPNLKISAEPHADSAAPPSASAPGRVDDGIVDLDFMGPHDEPGGKAEPSPKPKHEPQAKKQPRKPKGVPWRAVGQPERDALFDRAIDWSLGRGGAAAGWTESFLRDRFKAFSNHWTPIPRAHEDWWPKVENWLLNPNYQPRLQRGAGRRERESLAATMVSAFGFDGEVEK